MTSPELITSWTYGQEKHCPKIEKVLKEISEIKNGKTITIIDFLKYLREWVNYNGTSIMKYLYGLGRRNDLICALKHISFHFQIMAENFIISALGYEALKSSFEEFQKAIESNFSIDAGRIKARFEVYSERFSEGEKIKKKLIFEL
jgi:hypothetical protein